MTAAVTALRPRTDNPWNALWALLVGFFMILLDATIVAVANPAIMDHFGADYDGVIWVTSAYLLAYAVPLLLAGRLGDRFGPKNLYLVGLAVFTVSSLGCGLANSIGMLVAARVLQGVGAALLTPQTLSTITRIFPPDRRGVALSVWGATAGVATLVGPLAGGVLVDGLGWQWIFIVNVPIGIIGLLVAVVFVPALPTEKRGFDVLGVLLSGVGMFLVVFALQEGQSHDWAGWIWGMIAGGVAVLGGFVYWQAVNPGEPLIPLIIFRDNDFSMSNLGIAVIGFTVTAMVLPVFFYAQAVCGLSPTRAALLTSPMAIATGVLAPVVGKIVDRSHPRPIVGFGFSVVAIALTWLSFEMTTTTPIWRLVLPFLAVGVGMAFIWSPLAATATRNLAPSLAGAGSGVYNTMRQVGGVLGSAGMAAFMTSRISTAMPGAPASRPAGAPTSVTELPDFLQVPYSAALSEALLLPAFVALFGVLAALFLRGSGGGPPSRRADAVVAGRPVVETDYFADDDDYVEYAVEWEDRVWEDPARAAPARAAPAREAPGWEAPAREDPARRDRDWEDPERHRAVPVGRVETFEPEATPADDSFTEPFAVHVVNPSPAPAFGWQGTSVETWQRRMQDSQAADPEPDVGPGVGLDPREEVDPEGEADTVPELISVLDPTPAAAPEPPRNGRQPWRSLLDEVLDAPPATQNPSTRNGFHLNGDAHLQMPAPSTRSGGRHSRQEGPEPVRDANGDAGTYGRHSMPFS